MNTKKQTHIPYGFVIALAMIIVGVILEVSRLSYTPGIKYLSILVFLGGIILNAFAYSKANNADVTFGEVFSSGFKTTSIIAIVMFAWSYVVLMLFPDMPERNLEQIQLELDKNHKLSEEQKDAMVEMTRKSFKTFMHVGALFGTLVMGLVFSLIGAAFARKTPRNKAEAQVTV